MGKLVKAFSMITFCGLASLHISVVQAADNDWSGFYAGVNGGYTIQEDSGISLSTDTNTAPNLGDTTQFSRGVLSNFSAEGGTLGIQAGYNWQMNHFILGVEGDIQGINIDHSQTGSFSNPAGNTPINGTASINMDWVGTLRGRIGYSFDNVLIYATGGLAFANLNYKLEATETGGTAFYDGKSETTSDNGYVIGAGMEYAVNQNWSLKVEYQHIDLGNVSASMPITFIGTNVTSGEIASSELDLKFNTFRVGLNYKF